MAGQPFLPCSMQGHSSRPSEKEEHQRSSEMVPLPNVEINAGNRQIKRKHISNRLWYLLGYIQHCKNIGNGFLSSPFREFENLAKNNKLILCLSFLLLWWNTWLWITYEEKKFVLFHGSGDWEIQDGVCMWWGLVLLQLMLESRRVGEHRQKRQNRDVSSTYNHLISLMVTNPVVQWELTTSRKALIHLWGFHPHDSDSSHWAPPPNTEAIRN